MLRVSPRSKWKSVFAGYAVFCVGYLLTGRFTIGAPTAWPALEIDQSIAFIPWTIWIYWSQFLLLAFTYFALKTERELTITFRAMLLASGVSFAIFLISPTHFPRLMDIPAGLTGLIYETTYNFDRPTNCFPSLHAGLAGIAALALSRTRYATITTLWVGAICLSTMTTKQHFVLDVVAGLFLAFSCFVLSARVYGKGAVQSRPLQTRVLD